MINLKLKKTGKQIKVTWLTNKTRITKKIQKMEKIMKLINQRACKRKKSKNKPKVIIKNNFKRSQQINNKSMVL